MPGVRFEFDVERALQASKALKSDLKGLGLQTTQTEKEVRTLEKRFLSGLGAEHGQKALDNIRKHASMTSHELAMLQIKAGNVSGAMSTMGGSVKGAISSLMSLRMAVAGLGLGFLVQDVMKVGASFQQQMAVVAGVMQATQTEFQSLTDIAREMGEKTEWSASQAAEGLKFLGMAGFSAQKSIAALPGVLDLATAGCIDLGRASDIATNALTAMGLGVGDLGRINDVFVENINRTNTDLEGMAESFKYSAPVAKAFGYDLETLSALIGQLGNAGIQGSMAGTQLAMAIQKASEVSAEFGLGPGAQLVDVLKAINERGTTNQQIMDMFTERAGRAVLVLKDLVPEIEQLRIKLYNAEGGAKKLADIMRSTVTGSWKEFKSVVESVKIDIFDEYSDSVQSGLKESSQFIRDHKDDLLSMINVMVKAVEYGSELAITFGILKGAQLVYAASVTSLTNYLNVLTVSQNRFTLALEGTVAAMRSFLPILAAWGAYKIAEKIYDDQVAIKELKNSTEEFERKWYDLQNLTPIDLAAKVDNQDFYDELIKDIDDLIAKYEALREARLNAFNVSGEAGVDIQEDVSGIDATIAGLKARKQTSTFAKFLANAGLGNSPLGKSIIESQRGNASKAMEDQINKWNSLTEKEMIMMAQRGEIDNNLLEYMGRYNQVLNTRKKESKEAENQQKTLNDVMDKFTLAIQAAELGAGDLLAAQNQVNTSGDTMIDRFTMIKEKLLQLSEGDKSVQAFVDEMSMLKQITKEVDEQTKDFMEGKSLKEINFEMYDNLIKARFQTWKNDVQDQKQLNEQVNREHEKMLLDRAKLQDEMARKSGAVETNLVTQIEKKYDELLKKYADNAEMRAKIEEMMQYEILKTQTETTEKIDSEAKERLQIYQRIGESLENNDLATYKTKRILLETEYKDYLKKMQLLAKTDKDRADAVILVERWKQEQLEKINREFYRKHGDLLGTYETAWKDFTEDSMNSSVIMYNAWTQSFTRMNTFFSDVFYDGMTEKFSGIKDIWRDMWEDMKAIMFRAIADMAAREIMINLGFESLGTSQFGGVLRTVFGGIGGSAVNAVLGLGSSQKNAAAAGPITQGAFWEQAAMASAGAGGAASTAGKVGTLSAIGAGLSTFGQGALVGAGHLFSGGSAFMPTATNAMGAGMSLGYYGPLAAAGYFGGNYFSKNVLGQHGRYGGLGGAAGAIIGQALIPIPGVGALIGGLVGSAIGGIGPDKYKHAVMYSTDLTDFLDRYENLNDAPEGVRKLKTLLDSFESSLDGLPDWMGGRYESDIEDTIGAIEDMDLTVWANRYRDIAGNMAEAANVIAEAFTVGLDNVDAQTRETVLTMLNMGQEVPEALEVGLANWQEKVASYYQNVVATAADIFGRSLTDAFSVLPNMKWDTLTSSLFHGLANEIAAAITSATVESTIIKNLIEPSITGIDTIRERSMVVTGYDTKAASKVFAKTLSDEPVFDLAAYERSLEKESGQRLSDLWYNISEDKRADLVKQYAPDMYHKYTRSSDRDIFNTMSSSSQINYMKNKGFDLSPYEITKFDPDKFQKGITKYITQLKTDVQDMKPYIESVIEVNEEINKILFAEEYEKQRKTISKDITTYINSMTESTSKLASAQQEVNIVFEAWKSQMITLGATKAELAELESNWAQALTQIEKNFNRDVVLSFAGSVGDAFEQATKQEGFLSFKNNIKQAMYDSVSQGIINAFLTSDIYTQALYPVTSVIETAFQQAMTGGIFNPTVFESLVRPAFESIDDVLGTLEPIVSTIWDLVDYTRRSTIGTIPTYNLMGTSIPGYAEGGLATGLSFIGEKGTEWAVPTYEPERRNFLRDVGVDPDEIGKSIAKYIMMALSELNSEEGSTYQFVVDGRVFATIISNQMATGHTELIKQVDKRIKRVTSMRG